MLTLSSTSLFDNTQLCRNVLKTKRMTGQQRHGINEEKRSFLSCFVKLTFVYVEEIGNVKTFRSQIDFLQSRGCVGLCTKE